MSEFDEKSEQIIDEVISLPAVNVVANKEEDVGFIDELFYDEAVEYKDMPRSFFSIDSADDFSTAKQWSAVAGAYTLTTDTNEIADVIKAQFPNTYFNKDKYDNIIASIPRQENGKQVDPYTFYVNPRGASGIDYYQLAAQTAMWYPPIAMVSRPVKATSIAGVGTEYLKKGVGLFLGGSAVSIAQQAGTSALGGEQGTTYLPGTDLKVDFTKVGTEAGITTAVLPVANVLSNQLGKGVTKFIDFKRERFPKYFDVKTQEINQQGFGKLKDIGIRKVKDDKGEFITDANGIIYQANDSILVNTLKNIENGLSPKEAFLSARAHDLGIPLLGFQARGATNSSNPLQQSVDETRFDEFLQGKFGADAQKLALEVKLIQEENALRAFTKTLGITDENVTNDLISKFIKDQKGGNTQFTEQLGLFVQNSLKNQKDGLEKQIKLQYDKFIDDKLQIVPREFEKLSSNMEAFIKGQTALSAKQLKNLKTDNYLLKIHEMTQQYSKDMVGKSGDFVKGFDLKGVLNFRTKIQNVYNQVPKDDTVQQAQVLKYFHKVDEHIDGLFDSLMYKPSSNMTATKIADIKEARRLYHKLYDDFGPVISREMGSKNKLDDNFINRIVNVDDMSPLEIGFWFQNNKNMGLSERVIGTVNKIRGILKDDPDALLKFNDLIKKSTLSEIAFTAVKEGGKGNVNRVVVDPDLLKSAIDKWSSTKSSRDIFDNIFGIESKSTKQDLNTLLEVVLATNKQTNFKISEEVIDTGASALFRTGSVNDIAQLFSYKQAGLEGLYAYKVLTRDIKEIGAVDFKKSIDLVKDKRIKPTFIGSSIKQIEDTYTDPRGQYSPTNLDPIMPNVGGSDVDDETINEIIGGK